MNAPTHDPIPGATAEQSPSSETTVRSGERGQGMVEYAFILILVAIVVLVAVQTLGNSTQNLYTNITNGLTVASGH